MTSWSLVLITLGRGGGLEFGLGVDTDLNIALNTVIHLNDVGVLRGTVQHHCSSRILKTGLLLPEDEVRSEYAVLRIQTFRVENIRSSLDLDNDDRKRLKPMLGFFDRTLIQLI